MKKSGGSLVLLELTLSVLFFALSAAVILQVFTGAYQKSVQSEAITTAALLSEDITNAYNASALSTDVFFLEEGYTQTQAGYQKTITVNQREYLLIIQGSLTHGQSGSLFDGTVAVEWNGSVVHQMPLGRFFKEEVRP